MTTTTPEETHTVAEAARVLGLSPKRVRQLAEEGRLDAVEAGPLRVSRVSVLRVREERAAAATEALQAAGGGHPGQGGKPGSPPSSTPSTDLVPLLTSMQDRLEAGAQREKAEAHARGVAEAQARYVTEELHRVRAEAQQEQEELRRLREEVARLRAREEVREDREAPGPPQEEDQGAQGRSSLPAIPTAQAPTTVTAPATRPRETFLGRLLGRH